MQQIVNALTEQGAREREQYHVTLGELIDKLAAADKDKTVRNQNGAYISAACDSYRGYYSDLAFDWGDKCTVAEILASANEALGKTFTGYKGGEYTMSENTPLWVADYGCCGEAVLGADETDDAFVLVTKDID